jgi:23S rRNA pseudouridine2605 synthase
LVLLTNNGDLANQLSHPRFEKSKQYEVVVNKPLTNTQLQELRKGVKLHDGISKFDKVVTSKPQQLIVTLHEGRNRQIRRTFAHIGITVTKLKRTQLGNITLKHLASGKYRKVDTIEL